MTLRIGVDLGGTKIEAAAFDPLGQELARRRVATPQGDYPATLAAVAALVAELEAAPGCGPGARVGVGHPGMLSRDTGGIKNANSTCLIGHPLGEDLGRVLGRPVRLANDANCFALSEAVDGAGAQARVVFGVILGTGVGGGVVVDRQVLTGVNGIAGEWGHNRLPPSPADPLPTPPTCYCGRLGCVETWLSGPGLAADHTRVSGEPLTGPEIVAAAQAGSLSARASLDRYADRLARGLAQVINILDPEVIVLGGGLSEIPQLYERVPAHLGAYVFSDRVHTRLLPPRHGATSGVRGAAWLWPGEDNPHHPGPKPQYR